MLISALFSEPDFFVVLVSFLDVYFALISLLWLDVGPWRYYN